MSKERAPLPYQLTLKVVTRFAKEVTLRDGRCAPTLIVEGSHGALTGQIAEFPKTHTEKVRRMREAGFELGQTGQVGALWQVFFMSESWMSGAEGDTPSNLPPSQDPNRKEMLLVFHVALKENQTAFSGCEMIRNTEGRLVALRDFLFSKEEVTDFESPLTEAFVAGFRLGTRTRPN
jgi:hypothetical protein